MQDHRIIVLLFAGFIYTFVIVDLSFNVEKTLHWSMAAGLRWFKLVLSWSCAGKQLAPAQDKLRTNTRPAQTFSWPAKNQLIPAQTSSHSSKHINQHLLFFQQGCSYLLCCEVKGLYFYIWFPQFLRFVCQVLRPRICSNTQLYILDFLVLQGDYS